MDKHTGPVYCSRLPHVPAGSWIKLAIEQCRVSCSYLCYPFRKAVTGLQSICSEQILVTSLDQAESSQLD